MITWNYFCFRNLLPEDYNYNYIIESLTELILEKCNSSWGKTSLITITSRNSKKNYFAKITLTITFFSLSGN